MSFEEKIKVIDQLKKGEFRIDFSGGELLIDPLNIELIQYASEKLGKDSIGISLSGAFTSDKAIRRLSNYVNDVEISLDDVPFSHYNTHPTGYHEFNAHAIKEFKKYGGYVGVQTVITKDNISKNKIKKLLEWLEEHNIDEWSLLRFFPSGRGKNFKHLTPTNMQYIEIVEYIKEITKKSKVIPKFQYLLPNHEKSTLECRAVKKSIGILNNGSVISCFWALDNEMKPQNEKFLLGKVPKENINDILENQKSKYWTQKNHSSLLLILCKH